MTGNVIFMDGFDIRLPTNDPGLWTAIDSYASGWAISYANTLGILHGVTALNLDISNSSSYVCLRKTFDQEYTHLVAGFRLKINSSRILAKGNTFGGVQVGLFSFLGPTTSALKSQIQLGIDPFQRVIRVYRGQNGTMLATGQTSLKYDTWYYIEIRVLCHPTAGEVELRINGKTEVLLTGINTASSSPQTINGARLGFVSCDNSGTTLYRGGQGNYYLDDFIVLDASGGIVWPNGVSVLRQIPDADGAYGEWSSTGATNYSELDEIDSLVFQGGAPDNDTTYLSASIDAQRVSVDLPARPSPGTNVLGVQLATYAKTADVAGKITPFLRQDATDADLPQLSPTLSYGWHLSPVTQNPITLAPFTLPDLSALQIGWRTSA